MLFLFQSAHCILRVCGHLGDIQTSAKPCVGQRLGQNFLLRLGLGSMGNSKIVIFVDQLTAAQLTCRQDDWPPCHLLTVGPILLRLTSRHLY